MKKTDKKGFTIIEVVVVLAIAGLIFGIVFWALPNLQRSNRDSARRTIIGNVIANLDQYAANNAGAYPNSTTFPAFISSYFPAPGGLMDPLLDVNYVPNYTSLNAAAFTDYSAILFRNSAKCTTPPGTVVLITPTQNRSIAVAVKLEQGGGYCVDNN